MRLGAMNIQGFAEPDEWVKALKMARCRTSVFPTDVSAPEDVVRRFAKAAERENILIAEVGAWGDVLHDSDRGTRKDALALAKRALYVADECGARCAVNISGSRGHNWDGPDRKNLTAETYDMVVGSVRNIIDEVAPKRSFYTLEPMPWMYPNDIDTQRRLIRDVDRKAFAVHFDPVNLIYALSTYFDNGSFIKEFVRQFGGLIKSVHAKDILLDGRLTLHMDELRPGLGMLDYPMLLSELEQVDSDMPLIVEHLKTDAEFAMGMEFIRKTAAAVNVDV